jgi:peptide-methionine (R)-S-oxide reductase
MRGTYRCRACNNSLFSSSAKYESGTGWPSFYAALPFTGFLQSTASSGTEETKASTAESVESIIRRVDWSFGRRVEVLCRACHSHLGHVFSDGKINYNSVLFVHASEKKFNVYVMYIMM